MHLIILALVYRAGQVAAAAAMQLLLALAPLDKEITEEPVVEALVALAAVAAALVPLVEPAQRQLRDRRVAGGMVPHLALLVRL